MHDETVTNMFVHTLMCSFNDYSTHFSYYTETNITTFT